MEFSNISSMEKPVGQVHGDVDRRRGRVHGGPAGGADIGRGGASPARGAQALGVTDAHRRWLKTSRMRRCRRGAHRCTSGSGEAA
jgi:hypothetical protein